VSAPKPPPSPAMVWAAVVIVVALLGVVCWFAYLLLTPFVCTPSP
jgi:hypothetical protein